RIDAIRHRQAQARVVDDVFQALDEWNVVVLRGVADEGQHDDEPERNAHQVLFHTAPLAWARVARAAGSRWATAGPLWDCFLGRSAPGRANVGPARRSFSP